MSLLHDIRALRRRAVVTGIGVITPNGLDDRNVLG